MKLKNKILASLVAVIMLLGMVSIPTKAIFSVYGATNVSLSGESLVIKNVNKEYDLVNNNKLIYEDYMEGCTAINVSVLTPSGEYMTRYSNDEMTFKEAGLHALQFMKDTAGGFTIYSDVIYIPVSTGDFDGIQFDGEFVPMVLPSSTVECPMPIDEDGEEDTDVEIRVFTSYGEEISALKDSITKRWKFTNKSGVLGKYFVEYTKEVGSRVVYKYLTIEFSTNATTTASTKYYNEVSTTGEACINIGETGLEVKDETSIYLFKYYDINKAKFIKADGSVDSSVQIYLTVYDEKDSKFYNFDTKKFDLDLPEEGKILTSDAKLENFNLQSIDHFSMLSKYGHDIKFTYTAEVDGKTITASKTLTEDFNEKAVKVSTKTLVQNEITDIVIVETVNETLLGTYELPAVVVSADKGYNLEGLKEIVKSTHVEISPRSGSDHSSKTERSEEDKTNNKVGFDILNKGNIFEQSYVFNYNKNLTSSTSWELKYVVAFGDEDGDIDEVLVNVSYTIFLLEESADTTAPSKLTISGGAILSTDGTYYVPSATAEDKNNEFKTTTGATIAVTLIHPNGSTETVDMEETLEGLADGSYTLKYTATDYCGNTRVKTINFKVKTAPTTTNPSIDNGGFDYEYVDGKVIATLNSSADGVTIYGADGGQFNPEKMVFEAGRLTGFEFSYDNSKACIVMLKSSNSKATVYRGIKLFNGTVRQHVRSIGFYEIDGDYTRIVPNNSMEVQVFQKLLWFGSKSFELTAPENALYRISDGNEFEFFTAGTYTIKSTEEVEINGVVKSFEATTTINVKNKQDSFSVSLPIGHKLVAEKGEEVSLSKPVIKNYFGYDIRFIIKDSAGNDVTNECLSGETFIAPRNDEYTITYTITSEDMKKMEYPIVITTGNVALPQISISNNNESVLWEGESIKYVIQNASAIDKNGKDLAVSVTVFNQYGQELSVKTEGNSKYVMIESAGFYTIRYSAVDEDGKLNLVESIFAVEFPEKEEDDKLSVWAIIGIVLGSIVGAGAIALLVIVIIKYNKKKVRFINKAKSAKKQEKKQQIENVKVYTIAESKDEKHWLAKAGNRTIAKVESKQEAIDKIREVHKKGEFSIKVYNKNGRLIDSI